MDILSICPPTKDIISDFKRKISECTQQLKQNRFSKVSYPNQEITFEQQINNVDVYHLQEFKQTVPERKTSQIHTQAKDVNITSTSEAITQQININVEDFKLHPKCLESGKAKQQTNFKQIKTENELHKNEYRIELIKDEDADSTVSNEDDQKENQNNTKYEDQNDNQETVFVDQLFIDDISKYDLDNDNNHDSIIMVIDVVDPKEPEEDDITLEEAQRQINEYLKVVSVSELGELTTTTTAAVHFIKVKEGTTPIKQKQRRIMYHFQKDFDKVLDEMLKSGKISESKSGWASPLRLVGKKDGGVRVTVDYKQLNNVTEKIAYPIPFIDEIFQRLSYAKYYTVLDLTSAYYQVSLDPSSRHYTAFICQRGLFEYNVLPMGITNATETFQRLMNNVFEGILHKIVETYLDDIIIYSQSLKSHVEHVKMVVDRLIKHVLRIRLEKCTVAQREIEYLSHIICHGCIRPNPKKTQDLLKYKPPFNKKQAAAFMGKASYYKRFIQHFASIVSPLNEFTKDNKLKWTEEMTETVLHLQKRLTSEPILILPRMNEPFQIESDASGYGVGAVLAQERNNNWLPVAYFSQRLNKSERNYSTSEKELYAIVLATEYFRQFVYGVHFKIITDHKPLQYLLTVKEPASRLLRWMNRLNNYSYEIEYRKGIKNGNADGLSRLPTEIDENENNDDIQPILINIVENQGYEDEEPIIINVLIAENENLDARQLIDDNICWLYNLKVKAVQENVHHIIIKPSEFQNKEQRSYYAQWNKIFIIKGTLYRAWKIETNGSNQLVFQFIVPQQKRREIVETAHDKTLSGHCGVEKTQFRIRQRYYWPSWEKEVRDYVLSCETCQCTKALNSTPRTPLQIITSNFPFDIIQADIAGEFVESKNGNKWFLIIIDHFTKWADIHAMPDAKTDTVANCIVKTILKFGIPNQIITDQGPNFQAEMLQHVYDLLDVYKTRTTPYHPEADGGSEIAIKAIKNMIKCYIENENQRDWDEKLPFFVFAHNSATHATTGFTPFELLMGRQQKLPIDLFEEDVFIELPVNNHEFVNQLKENFNTVYKLVKENRQYKMEKAKFRHDRKVVGCNFQKSDKVWLLIKKHKKGITSSIANKFEGPYTIVDILDNGIDYIIKHDRKRARAKTINRSQLRLCRSRIQTSTTSPKYIKVEESTQENNINPQQETNKSNTKTVKQHKKRGRPPKQNKNVGTEPSPQLIEPKTGYNLRKRKTTSKII